MHTEKGKSNPNTTLKIVIKPQEKRTVKREEKRTEAGKKKDLQKQIQNN